MKRIPDRAKTCTEMAHALYSDIAELPDTDRCTITTVLAAIVFHNLAKSKEDYSQSCDVHRSLLDLFTEAP
jgi:hypothetical protein